MRNLGVIWMLLTCATFANAQDAPRLEVFGGYSYLSADTEGVTDRVSFHGWEAAATANINRWFGITADFSGHYKPDCAGSGSSVTCRDYSYLFGPTVSYRKTSKLVPFGRFLVGANNVGAGFQGITASENSFSFAAGGGVDYFITRRIAIRLGQADYLFTRHLQQIGGTHQNNIRAAAGVVFTFGGAASSTAPRRNQKAPAARSGAANAWFPTIDIGATVVTDEGQQGALILDVKPGTPAAEAGLTKNDIIRYVGADRVHNVAEFNRAIAAAAGSTVELQERWMGTAGIVVRQLRVPAR